MYTLRTGATAHPESSVLQLATDLIRAGGVLDLSTDDHFKIVEKSGGADMSVDVGAGRCFVKGASDVYPVRNTATINDATTVITANASGNPRIDAVVVYIDLAVSPDTQASDVAKMAVVAGTPGASPVAPSDSDIQTAVGASNPFLRLADVAVANGETAIDDADITDQRLQYRIKGSLVEGTESFSATPAFDVSQENYKKITMTGNITSMTVVGDKVGVPFTIKFIQAGSGGYTAAFFSNIDWFGGTPVLSTVVGEVDAFGFIKKSDGRYDGYVLGQGGSIS